MHVAEHTVHLALWPGSSTIVTCFWPCENFYSPPLLSSAGEDRWQDGVNDQYQGVQSLHYGPEL